MERLLLPLLKGKGQKQKSLKMHVLWRIFSKCVVDCSFLLSCLMSDNWCEICRTIFENSLTDPHDWKKKTSWWCHSESSHAIDPHLLRELFKFSALFYCLNKCLTFYFGTSLCSVWCQFDHEGPFCPVWGSISSELCYSGLREASFVYIETVYMDRVDDEPLLGDLYKCF